MGFPSLRSQIAEHVRARPFHRRSWDFGSPPLPFAPPPPLPHSKLDFWKRPTSSFGFALFRRHQDFLHRLPERVGCQRRDGLNHLFAPRDHSLP